VHFVGLFFSSMIQVVSCIHCTVRFTWGNCCVGKGERMLSLYSSRLSYNPTLATNIQKYHKWSKSRVSVQNRIGLSSRCEISCM